jgi:nucleoside-diphosphate-sugar epimerase/2-polyprenyl-3-methyl-5-hydroxy-6-metoxy-1,4-benzoquinol methylase
VYFIGGYGYIGSVLLDNLRKYGHTVTVPDAANEWEIVDLGAYDVVLVFADVQPASLHAAYTDYLGPFAGMVDALSPSQRLIYTSTTSVYADTMGDNVDEHGATLALQGIELGDVTKLFMDQTAMASSKHVYGLRLGSVCGSSPNWHKEPILNTLVTDAMQAKAVTVTEPARNVSILGFVDLCKVVTALFENEDASKAGIYNVASFNATIGELADFATRNHQATVMTAAPAAAKRGSDVRVDCGKFTRAFAFAFADTAESVVMHVEEQHAAPMETTQRFSKVTKCRVCSHPGLVTVLDLGTQPLANPNPTSATATEAEEEEFPLCLMVCPKCFLAQLDVVVSPEVMFANYSYVSGTTETAHRHFKEFAQDATKAYGFGRVLDIACNDGTQLNYFKECGWGTYGVDPAKNLQEIAQRNGHVVKAKFWDMNVAKSFGVDFSLIVAQNVFAHVHDVHSFLECAKAVLQPEGRILIQTSQVEMFAKSQFDTVYHEHLSFFNVRAMRKLAELRALHLVSVRKPPIHGASYVFELTVAPATSAQAAVLAAMEEAEKLLYEMGTYTKFKNTCTTLCEDLMVRLRKYKAEGTTIIGFGAAAKAMTVMNHVGW